LITELRFSPFQSIVPPEPVLLADMWLSRVTTPIEVGFNSGAVLTSDGGSYQTAWINETETPTQRQLYIFRRNPQGVQIWQKKIINVIGLADFPALHVDQQDNLYIVAASNVDSEVTNLVGSGSGRVNARMWRVNANGSLAWSKIHRNAGPIINSDGNTIPSGNISVLASYLDATTQNIYLAASSTTQNGLSPGNPFRIFAVSTQNGTVVNDIIFDKIILGSSVFLGTATASIKSRNNRLWVTAGSDSFTTIMQISLDLQTIFSSWRYSGFAPKDIFPASDGGWYAIGQGSSGTRLVKLSSSGTPTWMQRDANLSSSVIWFSSNMRHQAIGQNGLIAYANSSSTPNVKNGPSASFTLAIAEYDHEVQLAALRATRMQPGGGNLTTGSNSLPSFENVINTSLNTAIGWSAQSGGSRPQDYRIIMYGHKCFFEDEAARFLDTGLSTNSTYFAEARSQLDEQFGKFVFDDPIDLPLQSNYLPPQITAGIYSETPEFTIADGILSISYYTYSDPEYIAPAAEGNAGFAFYTGNSSVQKVSVDAQFTPNFLIIANRAASAAKVRFNQFFNPRQFYFWNGGSSFVTADGLVELNLGNFKIAGRDNSLNLVSNNFVALALGLLDSAHAIVTYTGTEAIRTVNHPLGAAPELIIISPRLGSFLQIAGTAFGGTNTAQGQDVGTVTSSTALFRAIGNLSIELGTSTQLNASGTVYDMHVFRSCPDWTIGTANGLGGSTLTISLGFQPKAILFKGLTGIGTAFQLLYRLDDTTGVAKSLPLNAGTAVEADSAIVSITADGFTIADGAAGNTGTSTAFYLAIK
jgi:hypothetical protein